MFLVRKSKQIYGELMSGSEKKTRFIAELTVGANVVKVELADITMDSCIARVSFILREFQQGILQIHTEQGSERIASFNPVKVLVESIKQKVGDVGVVYAKLRFQGMVNASQGIVQLMHSITQAAAKKPKPEKKPINNSLRIDNVSCPLCHQDSIVFRSLEKRSMTIKTNIFGVPKYLEPYSGKHFCDFNLIRVIVCPSCFFSSNDSSEFVRTSREGEVKLLSFNPSTILKPWMETVDERRKIVANFLTDFFEEERSLKQAIRSYQLAVISSDKIFQIDENRSPRSRNLNPARKSIYYLFVKAELLMKNSQIKEAEDALKDIIRRFEFLFPLSDKEFSIRTAYLLGVLNIYFEDYRQAGKYRTFLTEYNKDDSIDTDSVEYKELTKSLKNINDVFQNREDFSRKSLKGFERPF